MLDACGHCPACLQAAAGSHPDLETVAKPPDKSFLPLELLIGDKEHRMREGLCYRLSLRPLLGGRKIAVIDDADYLNAEGANSLLKTLEEPPPGSLLILIGTSPGAAVAHDPLPLPNGAVPPPERCDHRPLGTPKRHCRRSRAGRAAGRRQPGGLAPPASWLTRPCGISAGGCIRCWPPGSTISPGPPGACWVSSKRLARRHRPAASGCATVVGFAVEFYRGCLLARSGQSLPGDAELARWVQQALSRRAAGPGREETCLEHCLAAAAQIDRNANQARP